MVDIYLVSASLLPLSAVRNLGVTIDSRLTMVDHVGTLKMRDWNMQDRNMRHQIAGVEYAGLKNTAPTWNEKSREHR